MVNVSLGGRQEVGASSSKCEEHNSWTKQEDSRGSMPDDRHLYEPKIRTHMES